MKILLKTFIVLVIGAFISMCPFYVINLSSEIAFKRHFGVEPEKDAVTTGLVLRKIGIFYNVCMEKRKEYHTVVEHLPETNNKDLIVFQQNEIECWKDYNTKHYLAEQFGFIRSK